MAAETVRVVARITAQADKVQEVKSILLRLLQPTRAEEGCIRYDLHQSETDPAEFVFLEEWVSGAAILAHLQTAHVQEALSKAAALLAAPPDIRRYHLIA
jgi:quinol monooxygenase YgiN